MSLLNIITVPNKILRSKCEDITEDMFGNELDSFMSSMAETMYSLNGVGLAAPQVGVNRRFLVADMSEGRRESYVKMVNPEIVESSENTIKVTEGCLSMPRFEIEVERPWEVTVMYKDPFGKPNKEVLSGYYSIVIQHEIDHLNGITILDKAGSVTRRMYLKKLKKSKKKIERIFKKNNLA
tara:strand:- start:5678 stop:6220 length:543 start_codon:yes stop_codon:yes gene_type:complete